MVWVCIYFSTRWLDEYENNEPYRVGIIIHQYSNSRTVGKLFTIFIMFSVLPSWAQLARISTVQRPRRLSLLD